jgi:hypothetical protein
MVLGLDFFVLLTKSRRGLAVGLITVFLRPGLALPFVATQRGLAAAAICGGTSWQPS